MDQRLSCGYSGPSAAPSMFVVLALVFLFLFNFFLYIWCQPNLKVSRTVFFCFVLPPFFLIINLFIFYSSEFNLFSLFFFPSSSFVSHNPIEYNLIIVTTQLVWLLLSLIMISLIFFNFSVLVNFINLKIKCSLVLFL